MNWKPWLLLAGAIGSEVTGSLSLKAATEQPGWYALFAAGFLSAFAFLVGVLKAGMPLGVAYGVWGAMGVALTAVFGAVLFGEPLTGVMAAGIALIMGGVFTIEFGSQRAAERRQEAAAS
ncbi:DMT family transporter [Glycomyces harbinensis]|uniref:Small multidrug resistance pump n=1 Tax=Glycomyces harbinensis TaxID=58114 RepID=A0A1G6WLX0_9ACTN|nr:SMR family transporter [Glycomyces harbinensis]SDD66045.1 small multidrug resistance pump [Glycomyces harbinensis]